MATRVKPVTKRRRSHWENEERTQFWVTIGFIALVVLALLILAGAAAVGYYNDHIKPVARVNGTDVSRDAWRARDEVLRFRLTRAQGRVREALAGGLISPETADAQLRALASQEQEASGSAIEQLIDQALMTQLASKAGIIVSDADVETALQKEASSPEQRQVQAIFVAPEEDPVAGAPTDIQIGAAREKAQKALAELGTGRDFGAVARQYSTDPSKESGGLYGTIAATDPVDPAWVRAVFALPDGGTTTVVEGADGVFRIGRVQKIVPGQPDPTFLQTLPVTVDPRALRDSLRGDLIRERLRAKVLADATTGTVEQVRASEIFIRASASAADDPSAAEGEVSAAHILYSPKDDPSTASKVPANDPAWAAAKKEADTAFAKLSAVKDRAEREKQFADLAAKESDDKGSGEKGGSLGYFTKGKMVQPFAAAVFTGEHKKGDVLGPVKSDFGWHVILFQDRKAPPEQRLARAEEQLKAPGADFAKVATALSDGFEAKAGGDLGWVARLQRPKEIEDVLFGLQAGQTSDKVKTEDGYHIYKLTERRARPLDPDQLGAIQARGFDNWYGPQRDAADIYRDPDALTGETGNPQPGDTTPGGAIPGGDQIPTAQP